MQVHPGDGHSNIPAGTESPAEDPAKSVERDVVLTDRVPRTEWQYVGLRYPRDDQMEWQWVAALLAPVEFEPALRLARVDFGDSWEVTIHLHIKVMLKSTLNQKFICRPMVGGVEAARMQPAVWLLGIESGTGDDSETFWFGAKVQQVDGKIRYECANLTLGKFSRIYADLLARTQ